MRILLQHLCGRVLRSKEDARAIKLHCFLERVQRSLPDRSRFGRLQGDSCIVAHNVQSPTPFDCLPHNRFHLSFVGHIALDENCLAAILGNQVVRGCSSLVCNGTFGSRLVADIYTDNVCPFAGISKRYGSSDTC